MAGTAQESEGSVNDSKDHDDATRELHEDSLDRDDNSPAKHPQQIGRYRIEKLLGQGGFGLVYLAHDQQLNRLVAIKVPHARLISRPDDAEAYLAEARTVANLDHAGIVPVYDVGSSENCPCYIVSKYIEGADLTTKLKQQRLKYQEAAELVATVAEALHYAHKQGLVHRDIKPGNILVGKDGQPYVVDFGLALREENIGKGPKYAGTPAYMSPEQTRGEGHRVDGRSDIFSLGVVLYELLACRRPFRGDTPAELIEQVTSYEAKPLRQYDDHIPKELERICHKAIAKRASERYSTAKDFTDDLRHFLAEQKSIQSGASPGGGTSAASASHATIAVSAVDAGTAFSASRGIGSSDSQPIKILPKGLRSFDAHDADFFLELLPGPRDRNGLPDSLRFWKTRIEETDADNTCSIGLIYGPSGCGKSSLVKAGLLPRLSEDVISVYIEAIPEETEARLLHGLRKRCPALEDSLSLKDTLAALRRGQGIPVGKKMLIVIDQFEQWLHAKKEEENTDLVQALRQCDGGRVQCIVMVRDDFWMAATRFMRELEIRLLEGQNSAAVDLFPILHAEKVLAAFGRAFGTLPDHLSDTSKEQKSFIKQSVAGLAEEGKVICVRLALFAEMIKGKSWTPATLKEVGGAKGVGVTFLEETFSVSTSPPEHRLHQKAARAVLRDLLPNSGTDIKGYMRSQAELLEASGYGNRPTDFDDLVRILDREIRLITPTDPEGKDADNDSVTQTQAGQKYFQLTHDYLVHSLREWLTRKQKETRRGRVELKLFDTSVTWNATPENRFLPSWWENLNIRLFTDKKRWTEPQRKMMGKAGRFHGLRSAMAVAGLFLVASIGVVVRTQVANEQEVTRIEGLVGRLLSAESNQLPEIVKELDANPEVAEAFLSLLVSQDPKTVDQKRTQLHARLARVSRDPSLVDPLVEELLTGKITYVAPIREQLRPAASQLTERFRSILRDESADIQRRYRAALALADYVPVSEAASWTKQDLRLVAEQLIASNAEFQPLLREMLRPIRALLLEDLGRIFSDPQATDGQRLSAANAFVDYAGSDIAKLSDLLMVATPEQYSVLYPWFAASPAASTVDDLSQIAAMLPPEKLGSLARVLFGQRRANAAVTLLQLGELEKVLKVFAWTDDLEASTQFIFRCRPCGAGLESLLDCLQLVSDSLQERYPKDARYGLLLALGEFTLEEVPASRRDALLGQLADWYRNDPSSGVHGAAGWLLRKWGQADIARKVDQTTFPYSADREWFTMAISVTPTSSPKPEQANPEPPSKPLATKTFYYTFIVFRGGEYTIGSVADEPDRTRDETRHSVKLTRPFALLDREITFEELIAFSSKYDRFMQQYDAQPADACFGPNWYCSVGYCRWLGQQTGLLEADQAYADPESLDKELYPREQNQDDLAVNTAPVNWPLELSRRGFRLPTESEWEVASRAGARTTYGFGSEVSLLGRFGWFKQNSNKHAHPPMELRPNVRGLFDLHGNQMEWSHDWYGNYDAEMITDPQGPERDSSRVIRGGSWLDDAANCRASIRGPNDPTFRSGSFGFRLALSPEEL